MFLRVSDAQTGSAQSRWLASLRTADAYNRWILSELAPHVAGRVLEIGCGSGTFTKHLAVLADQVTAIDIDRDHVALARAATAGHQNVNVTIVDVMEAEWSNLFETAVALEVIEHIEDERAVLANVLRALVPGGRLVLKVPAGPAVFGSLDRAVGHHRRYTRSNLVDALRCAGFGEIDAWYFNAVGTLGWWVNGKVLRRSKPPTGHIRIFDRLVPAVRRIEQALHPPLGLSLFAVASKPVSA